MQTLINNIDVPMELKEYDNWVMWKLENIPNKTTGEIRETKIPYQVNGLKADSTNSHTWVNYDKVVDVLSGAGGVYNGIGFVLTKDTPYTVIDLDDCFIDGELTEEAREIVRTADSYTEVSQSGNGLHIFLKGKKPGNRSKNAEKGFEMYDSSRFIIMTGDRLKGTAEEIKDSQMMVDFLYDNYFPDVVTNNKEVQTTVSPNLTDEAVIRIASKAKNGDKFSKLYKGDIPEYGSQSEADQALCNILAFYTQDFEQIDRIFTSSGLYRDKWDRDDYKDSTISNAIDILTTTYQKKPNYQITFDNEAKKISNNELIPKPFLIKYGNLYKTVTKGSGKNEEEIDILISRNIPFLTKEYHNMEYPKVFYELEWKDRGKTVKEIVPASIISIRKDLLELSNKGFSVNDANARELIVYFDRYLQINELPRHHAVERLGKVKDNFVHPIISKDVEIIALDHGEKQLLESIKTKGSAESWKKEVLNRIHGQPKALLMVLASFASVIIEDLKIEPFIVDLSGTTSTGKSTTLKLATSVWGTSDLMSEWNATSVAIERKAAFLNSFPLILDDTRKANQHILQNIIYQFSGGRAKGRGSVKGSQRESTWNNIMLSTGEVSINDYAENAGGVAARVIPITDQPLKKDHENVMALLRGVEDNYGVVGMDFLKAWTEKKEKFIPQYNEIRNHYLKKAEGNEVLTRIANYYAAIHFTGSILNHQLNFDIDLESIDSLFNEIAEENKSIDKPLQFLETILTDLDSSRNDIYYNYEPKQSIKAIYKNDQLHLLISYVNEMLGVESNTIRKEWLKRGVSIENFVNKKRVDYRQTKHKGTNFRVISINMDYVEELGFDFEVDLYQ